MGAHENDQHTSMAASAQRYFEQEREVFLRFHEFYERQLSLMIGATPTGSLRELICDMQIRCDELKQRLKSS